MLCANETQPWTQPYPTPWLQPLTCLQTKPAHTSARTVDVQMQMILERTEIHESGMLADQNPDLEMSSAVSLNLSRIATLAAS